MIDLIHAGQAPHRAHVPIRLNVWFRSDLAWWQEFITSWNGISFLPPAHSCPTLEMASDASGSWGCGAWYGNSWFQIPWTGVSIEHSIVVKELIPILVAGVIWGCEWTGHRVICHCDNQAVVACLRSRTSRHKVVMHLLRTLVFVEAHFETQICPQYINTHANHLADDISRNNVFSFLSKVPSAHPYPSIVPP